MVWVIALVVLSLQPGRIETARGRSFRHQILHVSVFGATGLLFLALARNRREELNAVAAVVALATAIEVSQFLIYRLPAFEWWDVREDSIGAVVALVVHQIWPYAVL
jgi:VanZ family protein